MATSSGPPGASNAPPAAATPAETPMPASPSQGTSSAAAVVELAPPVASQTAPVQSVLDINALVEIDHEPDSDSAIGDDVSDYTTSLTSSIYNYTYENGRTYHAYREGKYIIPNDDREQERLDLVHHLWKLILGGELYCAPIRKDVARVLDVGTGTGIWAIEFADDFPGAQVTGNDLSPIQPSWVPPNCEFEVDDCESEWPYRADQAFDFIHIRQMIGSITRWQRFFGQVYTHLTPGGWVEVQEHAIRIHAEEGDGHLPENLSVWLSELERASLIFGTKMNIVETLRQHVIDAGFEDVAEDIYKVPIGNWPKEQRLKHLGGVQLCAVLESAEAYSLALFTRFLGYDLPRLHALLAGVRSELKSRDNHLFCTVHIIRGRKPE